MKTPKQLLLAELKKEGLNIAENAAEGAVKAVFRAVAKFAAESENKVDDVLIAILPVIEPHVLKMLDGIDGVKDDEQPAAE